MNSCGLDIAAVRSSLARLGATLSPAVSATTKTLYAPLISAQSATGIAIERDRPYGPHARQKLDIFRPLAGTDLPIAIYIPGGGFVRGDKGSESGFYSNVGLYFANHGCIGITANYRLATEFGWPAGIQDVSAIVAWAMREASALGGDPKHIVILGHSAGACHVAGYLFDRMASGSNAPGIAGAILISGMYRATEDMAEGAKAYFGSSKAGWATRSPIAHVDGVNVPVLLCMSELDPEFVAVQTFDMATALSRSLGQSPGFAWFAGHNHFSSMCSLGSGQEDVGLTLLRFVQNPGSIG